ncbi:MAG: hypothetical protein J6N70_02320 [Oribacterium sp.]|nr:hypothetical protein [Oribacterium sp.]
MLLNANKAGTSLASASAAGLLRTLSNNTSQYLRGDGSWQNLQNNATTTSAGYALDARMGKTLQTGIDSKSSVTTEHYTYKIPTAISANSFYTATIPFTPPTGYIARGVVWLTKSGAGNGYLLVSAFSAGGGGGNNAQITFYNAGSAIAANAITINTDVLFIK